MYPISVFFFLNVRCVCVCNCIIIIYYKCMNIRKNWKSSQWPIESCVVWPDFAAASLIINSNIAVRFLLGGICEQERTYTIFSSLPSLLQLQFLSLLPWFTGLLRFVRCHSQENDNHQSERILAARSHHTSPQIANIVFILSLSHLLQTIARRRNTTNSIHTSRRVLLTHLQSTGCWPVCPQRGFSFLLQCYLLIYGNSRALACTSHSICPVSISPSVFSFILKIIIKI